MKNLFKSWMLFAVLGFGSLLVSCDESEDESPGTPVITLPGDIEASYDLGQIFRIKVAVNVQTGISGVQLESELENPAEIANLESVMGQTGELILNVSYTAKNHGNEILTITLTDQADQQAVENIEFIVGNVVRVNDADLEGGKTYNWTSDKIYLLDKVVYLEECGVLNIEAGTVVKFTNSVIAANDKDNETSALVIARGAKINAVGTADKPIIFTHADDEMDRQNLEPLGNKKWGGLVILGAAPAFAETPTPQVEGIKKEEPRGNYGGSSTDDSSGKLQYVSIRYTGVGFGSGNEIQGLTLGGVGLGTVISHIDIFSSNDDGVEIFGGTVNIKNISVAFASDDSFDFDFGWKGAMQYLFALQGKNLASDHAGEWDGAKPDDAALYTDAKIFNATIVGPGTDSESNKSKLAILMRDNFAGQLANSVLTDFPGAGIEVEDLGEGKVDAYERINNSLFIRNNTFSKFKGATDLGSLVRTTEGKAEDAQGTALKAHLTENNNEYVAGLAVAAVSRATDGMLDPRPVTNNNNVYSGPLPEGIEQAGYRGAFEAGKDTWLKGWSTLAKYGYLKY